MDPNEALGSLGNPWRKPWQMILYNCLCIMIGFIGCWHMLGIVFIGEEPEHTCALPPGVSRNDAIPYEEVDGLRHYDKCRVYVNYSASTNETEPCPNGWVYDDSVRSIVSKWDLVCKHNYASETTQTALVFGVLIGAMTMTILSDKFGRKRTCLINICLCSATAFVTAFVDNYYLFTGLRFLVGVFQQGIMLPGFVLACELFPAEQRTMAGILMQLYWPVGMVIMAGLAYAFRAWQHLLIATSLPGLLAIPLFWLVPESIPWLVAKHRVREAKTILARAARWNGVELPAKFRLDAEEEWVLEPDAGAAAAAMTSPAASDVIDGEKPKPNADRPLVGYRVKHEPGFKEHSNEYTIMDIFRSPKLRIYTLIMVYLWCVVCLVYYGLSLSSGSLAGNIYVNFFLSGIVEAPAYIIAAILLKYVGRRYPICVFFNIAGLGILVALVIPVAKELRALKMAFSMISKFGISAAFASVFLYAPELFPTTIRNSGLGLASVGGRAGNMLAPFSAYFAKIAPWFPGIVFGSLSMLAAVITLLLPETLGRPLPQTLDEVENWTRCLSAEERRMCKRKTKPKATADEKAKLENGTAATDDT